MSTAELRANKLYKEYHLSKENSDVKRMLMILLLSDNANYRRPASYEEAFKSLTGAWANDGVTADEEVSAIYEARVNGEARKILDL